MTPPAGQSETSGKWVREDDELPPGRTGLDVRWGNGETGRARRSLSGYWYGSRNGSCWKLQDKPCYWWKTFTQMLDELSETLV